ncbi:MAG: ankyrin repeat domain-containing protein [Desulfobacter sp.]|nr:MAG: ankyrin repeat domain-containing protein [Desulfobacter sp.]
MEQNTPFEIATLFMGILMFLLFLVYKIKSGRVRKREKKLLGEQLMTFVDKGYADLEDDEGRDILYLAATGGFAPVTAAAIEKGADPNRLYGGDPLLRILARDHPLGTGAATVLLEGGALPDGPSGAEVSPLWQCAYLDHGDMAKRLIDHGADVNFISPTSGMTLLMTAVFQHSVQVGRLLLKAGADVHIRDKKGRQAVDFAHKNSEGPRRHSGGDSAGPEDTHPHEYNEMLRQIRCLMAAKPYRYKKFKRSSSPDRE